jgi:carbamoylphosphate synthase large subunit
MGVHTGDSITVAPAMTLTDREYQRLRDAGRAIITEIGVDTGGITGTSSAFEPTIDYVVTKVPRFAFEKFAGADPRLTTQMS